MMMQRKSPTRALLLTAGLLVVLMTAGCFQPAGSGSELTQIEQNPTFTVLPSAIPVVPTADTPDTLAANPDLATAVTFPTQEPIVFATATSALLQQEAALPTETQVLFPTQVADAALQEANPFALTATFIVGQATAQAGIPLTQTAEAVLGIQPTATPIPGLPTATAGQVNVPLGSDCIHEVQATDLNLYRISLAYGVSVADIAARSGITNINLIVVGQKLTIPGCGTTGYRPPPTSIPSGTTADTTGQTVPASGRRIVVEQGQTLFEISLLYGVRVADIAAANGISNINYIQLGQELVIP